MDALPVILAIVGWLLAMAPAVLLPWIVRGAPALRDLGATAPATRRARSYHLAGCRSAAAERG